MATETNRAQQFFATSFAKALVEMFSQYSSTQWQVADANEATANKANGPTIVYQMAVEGALTGDCFVELIRAEMLPIAASILGEAAGEFTADHADTLLEVSRAALKELAAALSSEYGDVSVRLTPVTELAAGVLQPYSMLGTSADDSKALIVLYFSQQLLESLKVRANEASRAAATAPPPERASSSEPNLSLVLDVELNVHLRFGQRKLPLRDVLDLTNGSVIELDRQVEEPVELLLDGKVIARGEAVIVDGNYGLRITEIPQPLAESLVR